MPVMEAIGSFAGLAYALITRKHIALKLVDSPPPLPTDENMEEDDLEAADSGVGPSLRPSSSGRLSSLSHYSDGTIIQIPGERSVHVFSSI